jgi:hypothetical protein
LPSLYDEGWRQGVILRGRLQAHGIVLAGGDEPQVDVREHDLWIVVSQDCDLDGLDVDLDVDLSAIRQNQPGPIR